MRKLYKYRMFIWTTLYLDQLRYENEITSFVHNQKQSVLNPGSTVKGEVLYSISSSEIDRLAKLDYGEISNTQANISENFRIKGTSSSVFTVDIKEWCRRKSCNWFKRQTQTWEFAFSVSWIAVVTFLQKASFFSRSLLLSCSSFTVLKALSGSSINVINVINVLCSNRQTDPLIWQLILNISISLCMSVKYPRINPRAC